MSRFSERHGFKPTKVEFQIESMDTGLRNSLWNALTLVYWKNIISDFYPNQTAYQRLFERVWIDFLKEPLDTKPYQWIRVRDYIQRWFFQAKWYDVYDFIEFVPANFSEVRRNCEFFDLTNTFLEREMSGYRFVNGSLAPVTSKEEVKTIQEGISNKGLFEPASRHLDSALRLLSDRKAPDFPNSIKESISSIEAACQIITGESKATLGKTLKILGKRGEIHPSLRESFDKLYGFTSDAEGIRHALLAEPNLTFDDAKFMLVACSAFLNYLIAYSTKKEETSNAAERSVSKN